MHKFIPRLTGWTILSILLVIGVWFFAPANLPVFLYKAALVTIGAVMGYHIDRATFPYARPDAVPDAQKPLAGLRRAVVQGTCILGLTMGL